MTTRQTKPKSNTTKAKAKDLKELEALTQKTPVQEAVQEAMPSVDLETQVREMGQAYFMKVMELAAEKAGQPMPDEEVLAVIISQVQDQVLNQLIQDVTPTAATELEVVTREIEATSELARQLDEQEEEMLLANMDDWERWDYLYNKYNRTEVLCEGQELKDKMLTALKRARKAQENKEQLPEFEMPLATLSLEDGTIFCLKSAYNSFFITTSHPGAMGKVISLHYFGLKGEETEAVDTAFRLWNEQGFVDAEKQRIQDYLERLAA